MKPRLSRKLKPLLALETLSRPWGKPYAERFFCPTCGYNQAHECRFLGESEYGNCAATRCTSCQVMFLVIYQGSRFIPIELPTPVLL